MFSKADFKVRIGFIKQVMSEKRYLFLFILFLLAYIGFNVWINQFYAVFGVFLTYRLIFVIPYSILAILIGLGVALNLTMITYKLKQVLSMQKEMGLTAFGAVGGMLGGACPGCFVGLLPTVAGVFGVTVTLSSLPFLGFEIQIPTFLVIGGALYVAAKPLTCEVEPDKK